MLAPTSLTLKSLILDGTRVDYSVRVSQRARRVRIRIDGRGVEVVVPRGVPEATGVAFLRQNGAWVLARLARMQIDRIALPHHPALNGETVLFRGRPVRIEVVQDGGSRRSARIELQEGTLRVRPPAGGQSKAIRSVEAWLRRQARQVIAAQVAERSAQMGQRPARISIRDQRTRWGSCSTRRTLSFSWRLIMAPADVLDYVVVHEVAHLAEPNHSPRFWHIVATYCPDYRHHKAWLHDNAGLLHAIR